MMFKDPYGILRLIATENLEEEVDVEELNNILNKIINNCVNKIELIEKENDHQSDPNIDN